MRAKWLWSGLGMIASLALVIGAAAAFARPYTFHGSLIEPAVRAADFALSDQNGQTFRLSEQAGSVVLMFFGYTSCPDACPATMAQFKRVRADLGPQAERVRFVLVTVDPERDTPERLREYLAAFDPSFTGVTGSLEDMEKVWSSYAVYREKAPVEATPDSAGSHGHADQAYEIDHTVRVYAVDVKGNLRLTYTMDTETEALEEDVKQLLKGR